MIVWGGFQGGNFLGDGGRYNPGSDNWTATSTTNAPSTRSSPTAVWTGTEMIVWGGANLTGLLNTGGRYNPGADGWTATSTTNAPDGRYLHSTVWTSSEMIVWGGTDSNNYFNSGGRYYPGTDSWTATTTTNAPTGRYLHTAAWTGSEMIVWGGAKIFDSFDTGGRYCAQPGPPITLSAARRKVEGINTVHLTWSGATSRKIDVYRCVQRDRSGFDCNPIPIVTTANDGAYTDSTGDTERARYKYRVCEEGTSICSSPAEIPH